MIKVLFRSIRTGQAASLFCANTTDDWQKDVCFHFGICFDDALFTVSMSHLSVITELVN